MTDVAVVVVRYYGGVKLGTGGLARAYRDAAQLVLTDAPRVTRYVYATLRVVVPFASLNEAYRLVDPPDVLLRGEEFSDENVFTYDIRLSREAKFRETLTKLRLEFR